MTAYQVCSRPSSQDWCLGPGFGEEVPPFPLFPYCAWTAPPSGAAEYLTGRDPSRTPAMYVREIWLMDGSYFHSVGEHL